MESYFEWKKVIIYAFCILFGVIVSVNILLTLEFQKTSKERIIKQSLKSNQEYKNILETKRKADVEEIFTKLEIEGESFYIFNIDTEKEIYSQNKDKKFGIASLTKIMTSDVFLENAKKTLREKTAGPEERTQVTILKKNLAQENDHGLKLGEVFDGKQLAKFMMMVSSNDASSALTNAVGKKQFIKEMNIFAEKLDLQNTLFFSESGIDINENILGSYSSAINIAKLVSYFYKKYPEFSEDFSISKSEVCSKNICHEVENTNILLSEKCIKLEYKEVDKNLPESCVESVVYPYKVLFSKTGYTKKSGGSIAMIVEIKGYKILMVVLKSGKDSRFSDIENIVGAVEKYLEI
jgi:D-alanyl-D-alanine carboxypeptidase